MKTTPTDSSNVLTNSAHEYFVQNLANGMDASEAYLKAFPKGKKRSSHKSASRLLRRPEVAARLEHLKRCNADLSQWQRADSMDILKSIALDDRKKDCDRINAVQILNNMCGYSEPEKKSLTLTNIFQFVSPDRGIKE